MQTDRRAKVERSIVGRYLSAPNIDFLLEVGEWIELQPGTNLFREGEEVQSVFILLDGRLNLTMQVPGRGACHILTLGAGELVAWSALLAEGLMSCSAQCIERATLIAVNAHKLSVQIEADPVFGCQFMTMVASALAQRLLATRLQLLDLFHDGPTN